MRVGDIVDYQGKPAIIRSVGDDCPDLASLQGRVEIKVKLRKWHTRLWVDADDVTDDPNVDDATVQRLRRDSL